MLAAYRRTQRVIHRMQTSSPRIRVGTLYGLGAPAIEVAARALQIEVSILGFEMNEIACGLDRPNEIDAAVLAGPTPLDATLLRSRIWSEPRVALVRRDHDLASQASVSLAEVDEHGWVRVEAPDPEWQRFWRLDEIRGGPPPEVGPPHRTGTSMIRAILSTNQAVVTIQPYWQILDLDDAVFVPVNDVPSVSIDLAILAERRDRNYDRMVAQLIRDHQHTTGLGFSA